MASELAIFGSGQDSAEFGVHASQEFIREPISCISSPAAQALEKYGANGSVITLMAF
jgi:hypothetical protein